MTRLNTKIGWSNLLALAPSTAQILVVDDELEVRTSLQKLITRFGYTVRVAASAEEADSWLDAERFDAMLLDIELPRMKGIEFLGWALEKDPELPVIMLSGLDDPELAIRCIDNGARTYLVKPVESDFLRLALREALSVRRLLVERNELAAQAP